MKISPEEEGRIIAQSGFHVNGEITDNLPLAGMTASDL